MSEDKSYYFCGIGGSGMLPLAMIVKAAGARVAGSDRALDQGRLADKFQWLQDGGVKLFQQDGSGLTDSSQILIASAAIEDTVPDVAQVPLAEGDRGVIGKSLRQDGLREGQRRRHAIAGTDDRPDPSAVRVAPREQRGPRRAADLRTEEARRPSDFGAPCSRAQAEMRRRRAAHRAAAVEVLHHHRAGALRPRLDVRRERRAVVVAEVLPSYIIA